MRMLLHTGLLFLFLNTPAYSAEKPLVLKTVDSFGYVYPNRFRITGLSADGTQINLAKQSIANNPDAMRICENSIRQMMLRPGKWQLELSTSGGAAPASPDSFILNCYLTPAQ